ncbi:MAG TPA: hypothetical protein VGT05_05425 [Patescibacteria group bacterium]|nr:hypothetical protein [Patescibacteria group bacterium]
MYRDRLSKLTERIAQQHLPHRVATLVETQFQEKNYAKPPHVFQFSHESIIDGVQDNSSYKYYILHDDLRMLSVKTTEGATTIDYIPSLHYIDIEKRVNQNLLEVQLMKDARDIWMVSGNVDYDIAWQLLRETEVHVGALSKAIEMIERPSALEVAVESAYQAIQQQGYLIKSFHGNIMLADSSLGKTALQSRQTYPIDREKLEELLYPIASLTTGDATEQYFFREALIRRIQTNLRWDADIIMSEDELLTKERFKQENEGNFMDKLEQGKWSSGTQIHRVDEYASRIGANEATAIVAVRRIVYLGFLLGTHFDVEGIKQPTT